MRVEGMQLKALCEGLLNSVLLCFFLCDRELVEEAGKLFCLPSGGTVVYK